MRQIYAFPGGSGGANPQTSGAPLAADAAGNLYGTASAGSVASSIVFELSPPVEGATTWTETIISGFSSGTTVWGPLTFDRAGNLYGTANSATGSGGTSMVFELSPSLAGGPWTLQTLYEFSSSSPQNGWYALSGVAFNDAGDLYGTTEAGGSGVCGTTGCGTVYKLTPSISLPWTETVVHSFTDNLRDGEYPVFTPFIGRNGHIYGTTAGGAYNGGAAYELVP